MATMTQSICAASMPARSSALRGGRHATSSATVSSGVGPAALDDAGALRIHSSLESMRLDDLGVGDDPATAGRRRRPGSRRAAAPVAGASMAGSCGHRSRGAAGRAAGRGRPGRRPRPATRRSCRRAARSTGGLVAQARRRRRPARRARAARALAAGRRRRKVPLAGADQHPPGRRGRRSGRRSPCFATNARAASSWSGVLSANVSTPGSARLAMPVSVPAGGISSTPVTPRSAIVSHAQVPAHRVG